MAAEKIVNYDAVSNVIQKMLTNGVNPSIKAIRELTGGKTENVARYRKEFFDKRDAEITKMADEIGSGKLAGLLASEMQLVVDRKTKDLRDVISRLKDDVKEGVELLEEKESECTHKIELAEAQASNAITAIKAEMAKLEEQCADAVEQLKIALDEKRKTETDCSQQVLDANKKADTLIEAAKNEATLLINAANKQMEKSDAESSSLRQQVKEMSVELAKSEMDKAQLIEIKGSLDKLQSEYANTNTRNVQLQAQNDGLNKDVERLNDDVKALKINADKFNQIQSELLEAQKSLSRLESEKNQVVRERDSLTKALSLIEGKK